MMRRTAQARHQNLLFGSRSAAETSGSRFRDAVLDKVKAMAMLATNRVHVLRQVILSCRKGGTISIPGVYVGMGDKIPIGAAMNKGLTFKMARPTSRSTPSRF